jgi:hypothetical protein
MSDVNERCPFLVPVTADHLFVFPVPAFCRRPNAGVYVPSVEKFMRLCVGGAHAECPGYVAAMELLSPAG